MPIGGHVRSPQSHPLQPEASGGPTRAQTVTLVLLSGVAGWLDALGYLRLGRVFTSFMTGNVIVAGLAIQDDDHYLLVRAVIALTAWFLGAAAGAYPIRRAIQRGQTGSLWPVPIGGALWLAWIALLLLGIVWHSVGTPGTNTDARLLIIALAAFAMGIQGAAVLALGIPGVATTALPSPRFFGSSNLTDSESKRMPRWFIFALILTYALSAFLVASTRNQTFAHFVPAIAMTVVLVLARSRHHRQ
ncbi:MAG: DUF1275 domain-containing protein [Gemmatimonas sp.]|nr:DUF1275 domain-containing protein [Gemmatimonas sp.]